MFFGQVFTDLELAGDSRSGASRVIPSPGAAALCDVRLTKCGERAGRRVLLWKQEVQTLMFDFYRYSRRSDEAHHTHEGTAYDASAFADYEDTPYLTGIVNLCLMVGVFVGIWTVIILLGILHRGFAQYWSLVLILVIDVTINIAVRLIRFRRRRALGLTSAERRWHLGLEARPPPQHRELPR